MTRKIGGLNNYDAFLLANGNELRRRLEAIETRRLAGRKQPLDDKFRKLYGELLKVMEGHQRHE